MSGYWLDRWDGAVEAAMIEAQPQALIVGLGAWEQIPRMLAVLSSLRIVSLRDTRKPLLARRPEDVVGEIADTIMAIALSDARALDICYVHGLDEEHDSILAAVDWELRAAAHTHARGLRYYGWHPSYGRFNNDEAQRFRSVWDACDLIGRHGYTGWRFDVNAEAPLSETVLRPQQWAGFPWHKWLASEAGFDIWDSTYGGPGNPGWRVMRRADGSPLSETYVMQSFVAQVKAVQARGGIGLIWFAHATQNDSDWSNYYETKAMRDYWRANLPPLRLPSSIVNHSPVSSNSGGEVTTEERNTLREKILNVHRALNRAKIIATFDQLGAALEEAYDAAGDAVNYLDSLPLPNS